MSAIVCGDNLGYEAADLVIRQPETRRRPFVKAVAEFAYGRVAALADIRDDGFDGAADLGVGLFMQTRQRRRLDMPVHELLLFDDLIGRQSRVITPSVRVGPNRSPHA
jgi:hypothetical protein